MRGLKQPLLHLENRITKGCRGINSPDRKRKAVGQKRHDSMQVDERYILRRVEKVQHISIGHDSGGELRILLQKAARRKAGYVVSG